MLQRAFHRVNGALGLYRSGASAGLPPATRRRISRVRSKGLTYLSEAKLAALARAMRDVEALGLEGGVIEAGCALGGSTVVLASEKAPARPMRVYDVFGTIPPPTADDTPDAHDRYRVIAEGGSRGLLGDTYYGYQGDLYDTVLATLARFGLRPETHALELVRGLVQDTLAVDGPVALAHVDVDWYEPVMTCLERIAPRLVVGGHLVLDDYHDWGGCRKATDAFLARVPGQFARDDAAGSLVLTRVSPPV